MDQTNNSFLFGGLGCRQVNFGAKCLLCEVGSSPEPITGRDLIPCYASLGGVKQQFLSCFGGRGELRMSCRFQNERDRRKLKIEPLFDESVFLELSAALHDLMPDVNIFDPFH